MLRSAGRARTGSASLADSITRPDLCRFDLHAVCLEAKWHPTSAKGYGEGNVTRRGDKKDLWQVSMGASYGARPSGRNQGRQIAFQ